VFRAFVVLCRKLELFGRELLAVDSTRLAVDAKHKLIVEQHVTNAAIDMGLPAATAGVAKDTLGVERIAAMADMSYYEGEDIEACEANGITPYVARPQRGSAVANGRFPKERFSYDPASYRQLTAVTCRVYLKAQPACR